MSRCMVFPPPGYLWNGLGGQPLVELIKKLNADKERKKQKRRRKEKRKRRENLETDYEHRRKDLDDTEKVKPEEFHFEHGSSDNFRIMQRRKTIVLHPNVQYDYGNEAKSFCACWGFSLQHSDIDVGLLSCLLELKKCMHQLLSSKQVDNIFQQVLGFRPFCELHFPIGKHPRVISDSGSSLLIESQFRELILNWVPPPLDTIDTEFRDLQWLYDRNQKTGSAASNDHFCYPYTTLF